MSIKSIHVMNQECYSLEHISAVLQEHHWECVFELNAPRKIHDRLKRHPRSYWLNLPGPHYTKDWRKGRSRLDAFINAFKQSEIFCAHEGIDRRSEYGMA